LLNLVTHGNETGLGYRTIMSQVLHEELLLFQRYNVIT
jgi:hypothetical protein